MPSDGDDKTQKSDPRQPTSPKGEQEINATGLSDQASTTSPNHPLAPEGLQELLSNHSRTSEDSPDELEAALASVTSLRPELRGAALRLHGEWKRIDARFQDLMARKKGLGKKSDAGKAALEKEALNWELGQMREARKKLGVESRAMAREFKEVRRKLKHDLQVVNKMIGGGEND